MTSSRPATSPSSSLHLSVSGCALMSSPPDFIPSIFAAADAINLMRDADAHSAPILSSLTCAAVVRSRIAQPMRAGAEQQIPLSRTTGAAGSRIVRRVRPHRVELALLDPFSISRGAVDLLVKILPCTRRAAASDHEAHSSFVHSLRRPAPALQSARRPHEALEARSRRCAGSSRRDQALTISDYRSLRASPNRKSRRCPRTSHQSSARSRCPRATECVSTQRRMRAITRATLDRAAAASMSRSAVSTTVPAEHVERR